MSKIPNISLYDRMLGAKQNKSSMNIDMNDISMLIELFVNVDQYINAQTNYGLCDIERTCKEREEYDVPLTECDCIEEAIAVTKSGERVEQLFKDIGFYKG